MDEHHSGWASFIGTTELNSESNRTGFEVKLSKLDDTSEIEYALHIRIARYGSKLGATE